MRRLVIADNHWQHKNILKYEPRPYESVDDMDIDMILQWNEVVLKDDKVFHLGDIALANAEFLVWLSYQLHGEINLIKGNHDRKSNVFYQSLGWKVYNRPIVFWNEKIVLSHARQVVDKGWLNIHGHSHSHGEDDKEHYCVSVEKVGYKPIDLDQLIEELRWK